MFSRQNAKATDPLHKKGYLYTDAIIQPVLNSLHCLESVLEKMNSEITHEDAF